MCSETADAAQALDGLEILKAMTVITCKSGNLVDFPFRSLMSWNHFRERHGSLADAGCQ